MSTFCSAVWRISFCLVVAIGSSLLPAQATTIWEDYQGNARISSGNVAGPDYANNSGTDQQRLTALKTIAADPANATRTGTGTNISHSIASNTLCNADSDTNDSTQACQRDAMGRVIYALVRFPVAGSYTIQAAHDDQIDLDLSSNYTSTSYRTVAYDIAVGSAAGFTGEATFETLSTVTVAGANRCALVRLYWNNSGGINHLNLRWIRPGATEVIPASALFDPSLPASSEGCTGSIQGSGNSLSLDKIVTARSNTVDQFSVTTANNATSTVVAQATTSGSGTGIVASTGAVTITSGVTYRMTDAIVIGNLSPLSAYSSSIACTRNGAAFTPGGSSPNWTATATGTNEAIVCQITNNPLPVDLSVTKTNTPLLGPSDQANDTVQQGSNTTFVIVVTNGGPSAVTGARVTDTPNAGLTCAPAGAVTCASSGGGCPTSGLTVGTLTGSGTILGTVPIGGTVQLSFTCAVQ